jgi:nitrilase
MKTKFTIAAAQAAPIYLDREASLEKAIHLIKQAAAKGAKIVGFGETWLVGYPFFAFFEETSLRWDAAQEYLAQAVEIPGPETDVLCETSRACDIDVVIGVAELDSRTRGTTYSTMLFVGREGRILGTHRKLKATADERTVWGEGKGDDLIVFERAVRSAKRAELWRTPDAPAGLCVDGARHAGSCSKLARR